MAASSSSSNHTNEITSALFIRMINHVGVEAEVVMKVMAFWMWLETQGFHDIMRMISLHDDKFLTSLTIEGATILSSLKRLSSTAPLSPNLMRFTPKLAKHFVSLNAILADKLKALKGIKEMHDGVCCVVFKYVLEAIGKERTGWDIITASPSSDFRCKLNPLAQEWNPKTERAPEEDRCLFLTFSNGYPLTESQISRYFTMSYGACVERVYVHWSEPRHRRPALFGKIVFNASYIPAMILNGQTVAKFWIHSRPLWCKRFDPRKTSNEKA